METLASKTTTNGRVVLRCKYLQPTNHRSTRISVQRYEGNTHGKDPQRIIVSWNHGLEPAQNYAEAVQEYLTRANWGGHWITSTITDGAVAVYAGEVTA
jgi:hypothetical protein